MNGLHNQLSLLPDYLGGHLRLALIALVVGTLFSIPAGILASRNTTLKNLVLGLASVIQTIPGLALLAIMVPLLNMIGIVPALIALSMYSLLPILRNTVVGIDEIDSDIIEAGRGVGMTSGELLRLVQLPLALPVIIAGLRTSAVWVVGIATLSTPVGATSLGNYIFSGLQTRNHTAILVGCVSAALLALGLDGIIHLYETGLRERSKRRIWIAGILTVIVVSTGATLGLSWAAEDGSTGGVTIGGKPFTEQYILMEFLQDYLDRQGFPADQVGNLGSTVAFDALRENQIDLYVDYSGTLWNMQVKDQTMPADPDTLLRALGKHLRQQYGITIAAELGFENAYCLAMRSGQADSLGIDSISDLRRHSAGLVVGGDVEFFGRPEWQRLQEVYDLEFRSTRTMDAVLMYSAVREGQVDVISAYTTDGRISAYDLKILDDTRKVFPPYDAVVLLSPHAAGRSGLRTALTRLEGKVDVELMRQMNRLVDQKSFSPDSVGKRLYRKVEDEVSVQITSN